MHLGSAHRGVNDSGSGFPFGSRPVAAARVWLMLRAFGFDNAAVLDGGFGAWKEAGLPVEQGDARSRPAAAKRSGHNYDWSERIVEDLVTPDTAGDRIHIEGVVHDGDGAPVNDAMIEIWQADAQGRYAHPRDPVLLLVPASRRDTLIARREMRGQMKDDPAVYRFDIHMQGDKETVFLDV